MGMVQVSKVAGGKGLMPAGITQSITAVCQKFGLPVPTMKTGMLISFIKHLLMTKKARGNTLKLVLVPELGSATIHPVSLEEDERLLGKIRRTYEIFNCRRITRPPRP